jgi:hypothetical protein
MGLSHSLQRKMDTLGLIPNQYRFGDLYNISNLEIFKEENLEANTSLTEADKPSKRYQNVDLYTIGDSFTTMDTSYYAGNKNFHIWLGSNVDTVRLNSGKHSLLVIEVIERTIQERLREEYKKLYIDKGFQIKGPDARHLSTQKTSSKSFWWEKFHDGIDQRLEFMLFNFDPFLKIKEFKANTMLSLFNRTHQGALISSGHDHLFYDVEANLQSTMSPFQTLKESDIDEVVANMNSIRDYYVKLGFHEVYFCFIPNKVTVCEPNRAIHNRQIERIERHPGLQVPVLSIHREVRHHPEWFHKGDGHWNAGGKRVWLRAVNDLVRHVSERSSN